MHFPLATILLALGATAAVFDPVAARDPVAAIAAHNPVAALEPFAVDDAVLDRRGSHPFRKIRCGIVLVFHNLACVALADYRATCMLMAEVAYNFCRNRALNEAPGVDPNTPCPAACEAPAKACLASCSSALDDTAAKPCIEKCLTAATTCCGE